MKIRVTEIEATIEDLRCSNTLADSFTLCLKRMFNGLYASEEDNLDDVEEGEDGQLQD